MHLQEQLCENPAFSHHRDFSDSLDFGRGCCNTLNASFTCHHTLALTSSRHAQHFRPIFHFTDSIEPSPIIARASTQRSHSGSPEAVARWSHLRGSGATYTASSLQTEQHHFLAFLPASAPGLFSIPCGCLNCAHQSSFHHEVYKLWLVRDRLCGQPSSVFAMWCRS